METSSEKKKSHKKKQKSCQKLNVKWQSETKMHFVHFQSNKTKNKQKPAEDLATVNWFAGHKTKIKKNFIKKLHPEDGSKRSEREGGEWWRARGRVGESETERWA